MQELLSIAVFETVVSHLSDTHAFLVLRKV